MLLKISGNETSRHAHELDEAFKLRHRVFVEESGWEALRSKDGREIDRFDHDGAVHFLLYEGGQLVGYQRLLPTARPHLLSEVHPHLCEGSPPSGPDIYEWTRFAVEREHRGEGGGLGRAGAELVLGFVEWGLANGVSAVSVEVSPYHLLKFINCHFLLEVLGLPQKIEGADVLAVLARFDERTRQQLRKIVEASRAPARTAEKETSGG